MSKMPVAPKPMKDETIVQVISNIGQTLGAFLWPTSYLRLLECVNGTPYGHYFCWNSENDLSSSVGYPKRPWADGSYENMKKYCEGLKGVQDWEKLTG